MKNTFHFSIFFQSVTSWQCGFWHQTPGVFSSALFWYQTVGTLLGREYEASFAVESTVSELEKCEAGFFMCQESAGIKILHFSLECGLEKVWRLLLLCRRHWRQAASDSWDLEEAGVCLVLVEGVPENGKWHTAVPPKKVQGCHSGGSNTTSLAQSCSEQSQRPPLEKQKMCTRQIYSDPPETPEQPEPFMLTTYLNSHIDIREYMVMADVKTVWQGSNTF